MIIVLLKLYIKRQWINYVCLSYWNNRD